MRFHTHSRRQTRRSLGVCEALHFRHRNLHKDSQIFQFLRWKLKGIFSPLAFHSFPIHGLLLHFQQGINGGAKNGEPEHSFWGGAGVKSPRFVRVFTQVIPLFNVPVFSHTHSPTKPDFRRPCRCKRRTRGRPCCLCYH